MKIPVTLFLVFVFGFKIANTQTISQNYSALSGLLQENFFYVDQPKYYPESGLIIGVDGISMLQVYNVKSNKRILYQEITEGYVNDNAVTSDGKHIILVGDDYGDNGFLQIINLLGVIETTIHFRGEKIYRVSAGPGLIAISNENGEITLYDSTLKKITKFKTQFWPAWEIQVGPNQSLMAAGDDNRILIYTSDKKSVYLDCGRKNTSFYQSTVAGNNFYAFNGESVFVINEAGKLIKEVVCPDSTQGFYVDEIKNELVLIKHYKLAYRYDIGNYFEAIGFDPVKEFARKTNEKESDKFSDKDSKLTVYFNTPGKDSLITQTGMMISMLSNYTNENTFVGVMNNKNQYVFNKDLQIVDSLNLSSKSITQLEMKNDGSTYLVKNSCNNSIDFEERFYYGRKGYGTYYSSTAPIDFDVSIQKDDYVTLVKNSSTQYSLHKVTTTYEIKKQPSRVPPPTVIYQTANPLLKVETIGDGNYLILEANNLFTYIINNQVNTFDLPIKNIVDIKGQIGSTKVFALSAEKKLYVIDFANFDTKLQVAEIAYGNNSMFTDSIINWHVSQNNNFILLYQEKVLLKINTETNATALFEMPDNQYVLSALVTNAGDVILSSTTYQIADKSSKSEQPKETSSFYVPVKKIYYSEDEIIRIFTMGSELYEFKAEF